MSARYASWHEAHAEATRRANMTGLDVAIRRTREYGIDGYSVSYAARNDSDYARAEIVRPDASQVPTADVPPTPTMYRD